MYRDHVRLIHQVRILQVRDRRLRAVPAHTARVPAHVRVPVAAGQGVLRKIFTIPI